MVADIRWLVPQHVIHGKPTGKYTVEELTQASQEIVALLNASDKPLVHLLIDESQLDGMPISLSALTEAFTFLSHDRLGWMIIYGTDERLKKFISSMVTNITRVRHRRFDTREEALEFLVSMDTTLPTVEVILEQY